MGDMRLYDGLPHPGYLGKTARGGLPESGAVTPCDARVHRFPVAVSSLLRPQTQIFSSGVGTRRHWVYNHRAMQRAVFTRKPTPRTPPKMAPDPRAWHPKWAELNNGARSLFRYSRPAGDPLDLHRRPPRVREATFGRLGGVDDPDNRLAVRAPR